MYPNRTICDVFEEMRTANKIRNFSYLAGLIEEAQFMAIRMETAVLNKKDVKDYGKERSRLYKEVQALREEKDALKEAV